MQNTVQEKDIEISAGTIEEMFRVGAHYGYSKSKRHPSVQPFIFGAKNRAEIFDLEKTAQSLEEAKAYVAALAKDGKQILFVGGKSEARQAIKEAAESIGMPYVASRWIGGTLTNFPEIRKRTDRLEDLISKKEKGELGKYTKKERLLFDREIEKLEKTFRGIVSLKGMPAALFVIDSGKEHIAVTEAHSVHVPVISLSNSDCDLKAVEYPIPGNDSAAASIRFFVGEIIAAYKGARKQ